MLALQALFALLVFIALFATKFGLCMLQFKPFWPQALLNAFFIPLKLSFSIPRFWLRLKIELQLFFVQLQLALVVSLIKFFLALPFSISLHLAYPHDLSSIVTFVPFLLQFELLALIFLIQAFAVIALFFQVIHLTFELIILFKL